MNSKDREIDVLIRARYPIIYIISYEENRVEDAIRTLVNGTKQVQVWSATEPFTTPDGGGRAADPYHRISLDGLTHALDALNYILKKVREESVRTVFVLRDFDPYLDNPVIVRRLRDLAFALKRSYSTLIFLSPLLAVPAHLEKEVVVVDYDLPDLEELRTILEELVRRVSGNPSVHIDLDEPSREALVKAALGLTADEAANVFAKAMVIGNGLEQMDIEVVLSEKKQIIRKTGMLEYYEANERFGNIGGLAQLKDWLGKRNTAFSERAHAFGLPSPRGILLLGVPGCGKSLTAKAIGASWQVPLLRFDVGSVFGKYVGESEANLRRALRAAEAVAPCVLWVDELEKAFASARGDDGGTTLRVVGSLLSWLQDKKAPVFVVGTANNIDMLPPELLRKGRLDEIFFVDLPREAEREDIFSIHLTKRERDPAAFDITRLAQLSEGYSGAEIEQAVIASLYDAFDAERDMTTADIEANLQMMVPLSRTMEEEVAKLRQWAATRARPASVE
ncbi:MAG: AAA family ATPase [Abitibacteriaceae bacterium]|nr:AAA family ATPase [Abditibacteriaceae bacterium]MBV9867928.1 AAA family ATPase [Abditibacteriaceae bacterium]